ncbi:daunorubicin resistance protein DrrA family ABC transporter ATP-binding protein [Halalkalibacter okhensis]|uniref:Antibiotic ABC transporter ATP-binding protein n=1 Tax=Halalkalibacter okhensis TaxID=333138 RepID=A0A0B0ILA3_9BACI|nr:daunorubicin resistance protein DrrA family ABC transporter ATP-binding protein [Halalkalibacter okhensis]KHF41677.1 antibiotic ABC transporter ATP-binding protein [Halalkalibacter okhensis]
MLETENLQKVFKGRKAVDGVSFYMDKGESVGLLGPNGAGKSTTISMISSLVKPTSGEVRLHGQSVLKDPGQIRRVLGVVPQEIALYQELTAYENLKFFGRIYGLKGKELERRIQEVLELVGLIDRQKEVVKTYSGGMQRRINIAAAMLHSPEILIMDEPTVGIDPQSRSHILEMVRELNREKGLSVLYTSHYMEEVERLCDRVYIMDHGQVIAAGTKEELKSILSGEETIFIELDRHDRDLFERLQAHEGILQATETEKGLKLLVPKGKRLLGEIFHISDSHKAQIVNVHVQVPTLEDVFLHLTGRKLRD